MMSSLTRNTDMPIYNVTFPYKKGPYYTVSGIDAVSKGAAITIATRQANIECGNQPHKKPQVTITG